MNIYIDESGSFTIPATGSSISVVGALVLPDGRTDKIYRDYGQLRERLPKYKGEVKGRLLNEAEVDAVVHVLRGHDAVLSVSAMDMGAQTPRNIEAFRQTYNGQFVVDPSASNVEALRAAAERAEQMLFALSDPLFLQSFVTFDVVRDVLEHATIHYSRQAPKELAQFK